MRAPPSILTRHDEEPRMELQVNGQRHAIDTAWQDESLLVTLREALGLVGAKFGCGVGLCGACTVLVEGQPVRACLLAARDATGRSITTIEGLAQGGVLHPVQQAWLDERVPQCGYCQAGQIMGAVALLRAVPRPADAQIDAAMAGHLCRCGTQPRVRAAIRLAAARA
jgi:isoquinoline 1-oxidoreductase subunit alpha